MKINDRDLPLRGQIWQHFEAGLMVVSGQSIPFDGAAEKLPEIIGVHSEKVIDMDFWEDGPGRYRHRRTEEDSDLILYSHLDVLRSQPRIWARPVALFMSDLSDRGRPAEHRFRFTGKLAYEPRDFS